MDVARVKRHFWSNRVLVSASVVLLLTLLLSLLGYLVAPDASPMANTQAPAINFKPPGYTVSVLKIPNRSMASGSWLGQVFYGFPPKYQLLPYQQLTTTADSIRVLPIGSQKAQTFALSDWGVPAQQVVGEYTGTQTYWLGTDNLGRCMLSRLIIGARISMAVGVVAVCISLTLGIFLGAIAGYFGGKTDDFIQLVMNILWSIPTLLLVFAMILVFGRGFWQIFTAVGLTIWVEVARMVRGQVIALKSLPFVETAQVMGISHWAIIGRHILPNIVGTILVLSASNFSTAVLMEAGLSFLGFGIQPPQPSWGTMLSENYSKIMLSNNPVPALLPALAIMIIVLSFNVLSNGLRDIFDVKLPR
jgi:ABC-type dipeptide/oligopeptide/nickel transport system permease subunit